MEGPQSSSQTPRGMQSGVKVVEEEYDGGGDEVAVQEEDAREGAEGRDEQGHRKSYDSTEGGMPTPQSVGYTPGKQPTSFRDLSEAGERSGSGGGAEEEWPSDASGSGTVLSARLTVYPNEDASVDEDMPPQVVTQRADTVSQYGGSLEIHRSTLQPSSPPRGQRGADPRYDTNTGPQDYETPGNYPSGHDPSGYDSPEYYPSGHDPSGHDRSGYDPSGYGNSGYDPSGYDPSGYDPSGYDHSGYDPSRYDPSGYHPTGYDPPTNDTSGYAPSGYQPTGYDSSKNDPSGYDPSAYDPYGYQSPGHGGWGSGQGPSGHGTVAPKLYDSTGYKASLAAYGKQHFTSPTPIVEAIAKAAAEVAEVPQMEGVGPDPATVGLTRAEQRPYGGLVDPRPLPTVREAKAVVDASDRNNMAMMPTRKSMNTKVFRRAPGRRMSGFAAGRMSSGRPLWLGGAPPGSGEPSAGSAPQAPQELPSVSYRMLNERKNLLLARTQ